MSALNEIFSLALQPDPYRVAPADLADLQWEAVKDRFKSMRTSVRVLENRCTEAGIDELRELSDTTPTLLAHQVYKSYPETFLDNGRWQHMNKWLQMLSAKPITNVNLNSVEGVDDWISRLRIQGHYVSCSSGTSGKSSFMDQTRADEELYAQMVTTSVLVGGGMHEFVRSRPYFACLPRNGAYRPIAAIAGAAQAIGKPKHVHFMFDEPLLAQASIDMGRMRRAISSGNVMPEAIKAFERQTEERSGAALVSIDKFVRTLLNYQGQAVVMQGMWPMYWQIIQRARALGVQDGAFGDGVTLIVGGGIKGVQLPPDYKEQILRFFGITEDRVVLLYGMSEMTGTCPWSHADQGYAVPPWIVPLVLSKDGERLLDPRDTDGVVEGRFGLIDLLMEGRWSGLISGDKVTVDFRCKNRDGYRVPMIRSVARYSDLEEGEDKLSCAGTLDAYVRGMDKM